MKANITLLLVMVGNEMVKCAIDLDQAMALSKNFNPI